MRPADSERAQAIQANVQRDGGLAEDESGAPLSHHRAAEGHEQAELGWPPEERVEKFGQPEEKANEAIRVDGGVHQGDGVRSEEENRGHHRQTVEHGKMTSCEWTL